MQFNDYLKTSRERYDLTQEQPVQELYNTEDELSGLSTSPHINHHAKQLHLGFVQSVKESEAYHNQHSSGEFVSVHEDYLDSIKYNPKEAIL